MNYKLQKARLYEKGKMSKDGYVILDKNNKVCSKIFTNKKDAEFRMKGMF